MVIYLLFVRIKYLPNKENSLNYEAEFPTFNNLIEALMKMFFKPLLQFIINWLIKR